MKNRPLALAVGTAIAVVVFLAGIGVAIGGSYVLTLHTLSVAQANHANLTKRQIKAQLANAKAECIALEALDRARHGIHFTKHDLTHPSALYVFRMTKGIHAVVVKSGCSYILRGEFPPGANPSGG